MEKLANDIKRLEEQLKKMRIFCEAVADCHAQSAKLRDILHKEMGLMIYKKSQPWYDDLSTMNQAVITALKNFDKRLRKIENKFDH